jgi:predicted nuclease of predicted toxin-antitoxin system
MGTLSSELGPHAERLSSRPRVYVDANVPSGLVGFMRVRLKWDVLFVLEHDELRRARDTEHYRLARQLRRTLVTLDRDYLDDRRFPPSEGCGVLVISAPHERDLARLLRRLDRALFAHAGADASSTNGTGLPLDGRKLHAHADWTAQAARS